MDGDAILTVHLGQCKSLAYDLRGVAKFPVTMW